MSPFRFAQACAASVVAVLLAGPAGAQAPYPNRPIRMIVPLAAASAVDNAARIVTQKMAENMGQSIAILNQPGAAGLIGAREVAKSAPDGYTLGGFNDSIMTMVPNLQANMPWDIIRDFEPVSLVATVEWGLVAAKNTPWTSAADFIKAAKASPGTINYASGGIGSPQHLAMALFAARSGISLTHVPYRGATQAATDVAAGQVPVCFQGLATVAGFIQGDQVKLLGVTTKERLPEFPSAPTVSESGLPDFTFESWFAVMVPAGTPKPIIDRLHAEIVKAASDPEVRDKLRVQGLTVRATSPDALRVALKDQLAKYAQVIKDAGIKPE
jgi:tripartite-type tricarboxylate transporter receptor subunit TctC